MIQHDNIVTVELIRLHAVLLAALFVEMSDRPQQVDLTDP